MAHPIIDRLKAYPEEVHVGIDLNRLIAYALKVLQDRQIPTTFENAVVVSFLMFPERFSLVGYPEYPDAARVNRALLQLGPKYRGWARGSVQKGFVLTESGTQQANQVEELLAGSKEQDKASASPERKASSRTRDLAKEVAQLEASSLFKKWKAGELSSAEELEFINMLGVFAYTPGHVIAKRLRSLRNTAMQLNRIDITGFLDDLRVRFGRLFESEG